MMKKFNLTALLLTLFIPHHLYAGGEVGNGGYAIEVDGQFVLLDLKDVDLLSETNLGLEYHDAFTNSHQRVQTKILEPLFDSDRFKYNRIELNRLMARKINQLQSKSDQHEIGLPVDAILQNAMTYFWLPVATPCLDVQDEDDVNNPIRTQVAYRYKKWIRYCHDAYRLDVVHFGALIFHEIFYGAVLDREIAKKMVHYLFSNQIDSLDNDDIGEFRSIAQKFTNSFNTQTRNLVSPEKFPIPTLGSFESEKYLIMVKDTKVSREKILEAVAIIIRNLDEPVSETGFIYTWKCNSDHICSNPDGPQYLIVKSPTVIDFYPEKGSDPVRLEHK